MPFLLVQKIQRYIRGIQERVILCVNLTELRDAQRADQTLFLGVSVKVSPGEICIWISRLSKDLPHQGRWAWSKLSGSWGGKGKQRTGEFALCLSWDIHPLLPSNICALRHPGSWVFRLRPELIWLNPPFSGLWAWTHIISSRFSGLQAQAESHHWLS